MRGRNAATRAGVTTRPSIRTSPLLELAVAVGVGVGIGVSVGAPALARADDAAATWHVSDTGLRGLDDGQRIGVHELSVLFPDATVLEVNRERFEIRYPGRAGAAKKVESAVDAEVAAVVSTGTLTSVVVYGPEVRASSELGVGSTIADLAAAIPELTCTRMDPDLQCHGPYDRFTYFARGPSRDVPARLDRAKDYVVTWWSWTGSGRPRSAIKAPMKQWKAERGGLGPIDRQTKPTLENLQAVLSGLAVTEIVDGKLGRFFTVAKGKSRLFWLRVWADHLVALAITSPKFATATGVRVGVKLDDVRRLEGGTLACVHTWSRGPAGGMRAITCPGDGVEYWFAIEAVTGSEPFVVPPAVDLDASKDLVLEEIHVELQ